MSIYNRLLTVDFQLNFVKHANLRVTLKHDTIKGIGVYATKQIKENEIVAYYILKVFEADKYVSPTNEVYTFAVFTKSGKIDDKLIADITPDCFTYPIKNVPYWGCFINEPIPKQILNTKFIPEIKKNSKMCEKNKIHAGDYVTYSVQAIRDIDIGDELTTYYGDEYKRDYVIDIPENIFI